MDSVKLSAGANASISTKFRGFSSEMGVSISVSSAA